MDKSKNEEIMNIINIYNNSTEIACRAIGMKEIEILACSDCSSSLSFCKLLHSISKEKEDCLRSYLYGWRQAEKLGEPYIYFCPYGLINWAVPIINQGEMEYFFVGGPTLIHPIDDFLLENIIKQNP